MRYAANGAGRSAAKPSADQDAAGLPGEPSRRNKGATRPGFPAEGMRGAGAEDVLRWRGRGACTPVCGVVVSRPAMRAAVRRRAIVRRRRAARPLPRRALGLQQVVRV